MPQTQYSLAWVEYKRNICNGLSSLQQNGEFVDMTFAADGHFVKVHQIVIALASPYLKELISSAECPHPVVFLNKLSYKTLCSVLEYIYTGEVLVSKNNLNELIEAARELHIKGLEDLESHQQLQKPSVYYQSSNPMSKDDRFEFKNTILSQNDDAENTMDSGSITETLEYAYDDGIIDEETRADDPLTLSYDFDQKSSNSNAQQNDIQPDEARNLEHTLLLVQPSASSPDSKVQQNVTAEIPIDNAVSFYLMVLAKLETLEENYKTLNEKVTNDINAPKKEKKFIDESIQSMLHGLSNFSVQFKHLLNMKQFSRVESNKQKTNIQPIISSEHELNNFEKELENPEIEEDWKRKFSIIFGKGKGRGMNIAYALVDLMFSRCFLLQCSWSGGSRTSERKICFKSHSKIIRLFYDIIHESDSLFSVLDCQKFFKNILKNSRQRNESKRERASRTKNRPNIKAKRKNLCTETKPPLPITGTSAAENSSEVSLLAVGTSGSGSKNLRETSHTRRIFKKKKLRAGESAG